MRCLRALEAVAETWGGAGGLPRRVRRHLESCPSCSRERERLERLLAEAARAEIPDPGQGYWEALAPRIRARLEREPAAAAPRQPLRLLPETPFRLAGLAAAAAVMLLVAWTGWLLLPPAAGDAALERMSRQLDHRLRAAPDEDRLRVADLFATRALWPAGRHQASLDDRPEELDDPLDPEAVSRALRETTAILSPPEMVDAADPLGILEELDAEETRILILELRRAGEDPAGPISEEMAG